MKLTDYLIREKISDSAFATRIGVSRQALWRYKNDERKPEWSALEKIAAATGGLVMPNDFLICPSVVDAQGAAAAEGDTSPSAAFSISQEAA